MPEESVENKVEGLQTIALEMEEKARLVIAHIEARDKLPPSERDKADLDAMARLGSDRPFWIQLRRAFEYVRDTSLLAIEMLQDPLIRKPESAPRGETSMNVRSRRR